MLEELKSNLLANKLDPVTIPLVMQWNKRDLTDIMPVPEMESTLNFRKTDAFETIATDGEGILRRSSASSRGR